MRVRSATEVNTDYQENPFARQHAGIASTDNQASVRPFDELLRLQLQQDIPLTSTSTEKAIAGTYWGLQPMFREPPKPEPLTLEEIAT